MAGYTNNQEPEKEKMIRSNMELELLKYDLDNVIDGMIIAKEILREEEQEYLELFKRCKSVLDRIKPLEEGEHE